MATVKPIYVDTCAFIAAFEATASAAEPARRVFDLCINRRWAVMTSELTIAELSAPAKNLTAKSIIERRVQYLDLFDNSGLIAARPVTRDILIATADIRLRFSLRLVDAIHVATALEARYRFFWSSDTDIRRLQGPMDVIGITHEDVDFMLNALDA